MKRVKKYASVLVAVAAAIVASVVWDRRDLSPPAPDAPGIESATTEIPDASGAVSAQFPTAPDAPARIPDRDANLASAMDATGPRLADQETQTENWDDPCDCETALYERLEEQGEAARQAEPKDTSWAYETEQLLTQYLAAEQNTRAIQISGIECRTSFCEIKALGTPRMQPLFTEVINGIVAQPWSTFGGLDFGFGVRDDGQKEMRAFIQRTSDPKVADVAGARSAICTAWACLPIEDCECASSEWQTRKQAHDAAKRAAEPKDMDWAYATEQGLQQLFATDAPQLQDFSIDCRTTYCEVRVTLPTDESKDILHDVLAKALLQKQFEFNPTAAGGVDDTDGRVTVSMILQRR